MALTGGAGGRIWGAQSGCEFDTEERPRAFSPAGSPNQSGKCQRRLYTLDRGERWWRAGRPLKTCTWQFTASLPLSQFALCKLWESAQFVGWRCFSLSLSLFPVFLNRGWLVTTVFNGSCVRSTLAGHDPEPRRMSETKTTIKRDANLPFQMVST